MVSFSAVAVRAPRTVNGMIYLHYQTGPAAAGSYTELKGDYSLMYWISDLLACMHDLQDIPLFTKVIACWWLWFRKNYFTCSIYSKFPIQILQHHVHDLIDKYLTQEGGFNKTYIPTIGIDFVSQGY